jgi:hypothetical protein
MYSPHVQPSIGKREELDNDCLYLHHPSRRLDLQIPLALTPLTPDHSPELIDNMYLAGVHLADSSTTSVFLIYIYILDSSANDIVNILTA